MARAGKITPISVVISKRVEHKWKVIKYSNVRYSEGRLIWDTFTNAIKKIKFDGKTKYKFWIKYNKEEGDCNGGIYTDRESMEVAWFACIERDLVLLLWNDQDLKKFPLTSDYYVYDGKLVSGANNVLTSA